MSLLPTIIALLDNGTGVCREGVLGEQAGFDTLTPALHVVHVLTLVKGNRAIRSLNEAARELASPCRPFESSRNCLIFSFLIIGVLICNSASIICSV